MMSTGAPVACLREDTKIMTVPSDSGSHAAAPRRGGGLTWLWVLLALLIFALLAWWLLGGVGDDEDVEASPPAAVEETEEPLDDAAEEVEEPLDDATAEETEEPLDEETSTSDETEETAPVATVGAILVGDVDLLAEDVDPTTLVGESVEADGVMVQAVVADEAFFVGPDPERTVLVRLADFAGEGEQESPMDVDEGETVSFTGSVEEVDEALLSELQIVDDAPEVSPGDVYIQVDELSPSN